MDTQLEVAEAPEAPEVDAPEVEAADAAVETPEAPEAETPDAAEEDLTRSAAEIAADELERLRSADEDAPEPDAEDRAEKPKLKAQFGLSRDGQEVDLDDSLLGLEFKYKASGEEHTKSLDELVRTAQSAHGTAQKLEQYRTERKELSDALLEKESLAEALTQDRDLFIKVLKDSSGEQFKALQAEYLKRAGQPTQQDEAPASADSSVDQDIQAGQQVLEQHIMPYAEQLAEVYEGADATEIVEQVLLELSEEPPQYLTADTVGEILNERIIQALEEAGYEAKGDRPTFDLGIFEEASTPASRGIRPRSERSSNGTSDLAKENQRLREKLEAATQGKQRAKLDAAPPAAGSSAPSGVQDADPILDLKGADTLDEVKRRLQHLQGR